MFVLRAKHTAVMHGVGCVQILGEGKPENQNHAMIFCFGECVQTVDMNQENRHAEALKMRCARLALPQHSQAHLPPLSM